MAKAQTKQVAVAKGMDNGKTSIIAQGTQIEGDFETSENLRIDGHVSGNVKCAKRIVIGDKGSVKGRMEAAEIFINGRMVGEALSQGSITLGPNSDSEGKMDARTLQVEEGAVFNGDFLVANH